MAENEKKREEEGSCARACFVRSNFERLELLQV